ncbi:Uncharacterised protein [Candidatus Bartonella washoeensis]|uniref:Uncharacterized protein n=1 Tax=Candidatus Bartonella washoeensis Sb944nv TaxID=1094563 RepID=J1J0L1_9HYPH|nr:hypothetical protein MCQ_01502 [Bartonella washoeensis Sb944nv]SPU27067.1 Uncharacterised protein [Bartonella washoeensis]
MSLSRNNGDFIWYAFNFINTTMLGSKSLEIKLALIIIISIVLGFLLFYSLKFMSKAEEIWQNIKQESGDIGEKKQKEGTP